MHVTLTERLNLAKSVAEVFRYALHFRHVCFRLVTITTAADTSAQGKIQHFPHHKQEK